MKRETEQIIQQTLENVVGYIDQLPNGEFIPSSWQPPKEFKNERFKVNDIPLPKAVIAISPWSNAANDFPSVKTNIEKDVILGRYGLKMSNQIDNPIYFQGANYKEPYLEESKAAWQEMREFLEEIF